MSLLRSLLIVCALFSLGSAVASTGSRLATQDLTIEAFPAAAESIRTDLADPDGVYADMGEQRRRQVEAALFEIGQLLAGNGNDRSSRRQIEDLQQEINTALASNGAASASVARSDRSELICRREKRSGSNIPEVVCRKRDELEQSAQQARDMVRDSR